MSTKIYSSDVFGNVIEVQCKITRGLPSVQIVGLANKALDESRERVRAAFHSSGLEFPKGRVLVNLSPADLPKDGSAFDLPIAISILQAAHIIRPLKKDIFASGELSLDGRISGVRGIIGRLRPELFKSKACLISKDNYEQAILVSGRVVITIESLAELISILSGVSKPSKPSLKQSSDIITADAYNHYDEVKGQRIAKRALQIAASGMHNVLLYGPPGTGKSMLAKALASIMPNLTPVQRLETTHLHSLRDADIGVLIDRPPIRSPHHSASNISILGGGSKAKPGEVSLAHNGVLFLDELLEFSRGYIEALRQPLEDRQITISRAEHNVTYPASFLLIATMNPCPCGNLGSSKTCSCLPISIHNYQKKLSGPISDRIDLFVKVDEVPVTELLKSPTGEEFVQIRQSVSQSRQKQLLRNSGILNSELNNKSLRQLKIKNDARLLLDDAATKMNISPRAYFRIIKVARTIADIECKDEIDKESIAESLQYRENLPSII